MCAEALSGEQWESGFDVHALGVVIFEIMTNARPFDGVTLSKLQQLVIGAAMNPLTYYREMRGFGPFQPTIGLVAARRKEGRRAARVGDSLRT
jgi:hypothetical protein